MCVLCVCVWYVSMCMHVRMPVLATPIRASSVQFIPIQAMPNQYIRRTPIHIHVHTRPHIHLSPSHANTIPSNTPSQSKSDQTRPHTHTYTHTHTHTCPHTPVQAKPCQSVRPSPSQAKSCQPPPITGPIEQAEARTCQEWSRKSAQA